VYRQNSVRRENIKHPPNTTQNKVLKSIMTIEYYI